MASEILAKSVVGTIVIQDVLCETCDELQLDEKALGLMVELLRPALNQVVEVCNDPAELAVIVEQHRDSLAAVSPVAKEAFEAFVSNVLDAA